MVLRNLINFCVSAFQSFNYAYGILSTSPNSSGTCKYLQKLRLCSINQPFPSPDPNQSLPIKIAYLPKKQKSKPCVRNPLNHKMHYAELEMLSSANFNFFRKLLI